MSKSKAKSPPVETLNAANFGSSIEVSVRGNLQESEHGPRAVYSFSFRRSFNVDGEWKETTSMRLQDIPVLQYLLAKAYDAAMTRSAADANGDAG